MRNVKLTTALTFKVPEIQDWTDRLPKKQSWETLPKKQNIIRGVWDGTYHTGFRNPEDIDTIVIHHSGPPEGTLVSHANYHASQWGAGISYHIAIDESLIKQLNNLLSFTFHVSGNNTYTVAIVVNADLSKRDLTALERELLYAAILTVKSLLPIRYVLGHNELNPTACPCISLDKVRNDISYLEFAMSQANSWSDKINKVQSMTNQFKWYTSEINKGKGVDSADDCMNRYILIHEFMKEKGWFGE